MNKHLRRAEESSKGFTLVELVVVLATLAVLALTLLPAFASAKPNNLALQCMNNLRQWGAALRMTASDNNDMIARDGTANGGQYAVDTTATTGPGSPNDQYAWFNVAPPAMGEKPFSFYWNSPGGNSQLKLPFPGGQGKIWHCPAAKAASTDSFLQNGSYGFFSYVMNIDLKVTTPIGASFSRLTYPLMPKFGEIRNPSSQVLFTDIVFSPTLERILPTASDSDRNGIFPAQRSYVFPNRHSGGGTLLFIDGHSAIYKRSYVTNGAPNSSGANRAEKLNPDIWWNPNRLP
jgi:prepilin-type N-terminal cleavage/methylation domain-containing protein/prepilin-type processing-associated H-X9-DG protein